MYYANKSCALYFLCISFVQMKVSQGASMSEPLFCSFHDVVPTIHQFINYLHHLLCRLRVDTDKYSGHSFHIGAATPAASAGIEDHLIQTLGRWVSTCYTRYIRIIWLCSIYYSLILLIKCDFLFQVVSDLSIILFLLYYTDI